MSDDETTAVDAFVLTWWETFEGQGVTANDLFSIALKIPGINLGGGSEHSQKTKMGIWLGSLRDRIVCGYAVKRGRKVHNMVVWSLLPGEMAL